MSLQLFTKETELALYELISANSLNDEQSKAVTDFVFGRLEAFGASQAQQQTTVEEPELPEAAKCEGGWGELCVYYYTAAQMHEHYAAGVRAGAAGSQDANEEVVTITVPLSHINSLQVESIKRLVARTKHAHMTDVRIRINGNYEYFEADWLKYVVIGGGA